MVLPQIFRILCEKGKTLQGKPLPLKYRSPAKVEIRKQEVRKMDKKGNKKTRDKKKGNKKTGR
ncbi:MAG: hypothetical protein AB3K77_14440 [Methanosarcinaceae archaeon]